MTVAYVVVAVVASFGTGFVVGRRRRSKPDRLAIVLGQLAIGVQLTHGELERVVGFDPRLQLQQATANSWATMNRRRRFRPTMPVTVETVEVWAITDAGRKRAGEAHRVVAGPTAA